MWVVVQQQALLSTLHPQQAAGTVAVLIRERHLSHLYCSKNSSSSSRTSQNTKFCEGVVAQVQEHLSIDLRQVCWSAKFFLTQKTRWCHSCHPELNTLLRVPHAQTSELQQLHLCFCTQYAGIYLGTKMTKTTAQWLRNIEQMAQ